MSSRLTAGNKEETREKSVGMALDIIQKTREEYGRYFGICGSYHCLKACICKNCPSYSGGAGMFCSRGKSLGQGKKKAASVKLASFSENTDLKGNTSACRTKNSFL